MTKYDEIVFYLPSKQRVAGSNPAGRTNKINIIQRFRKSAKNKEAGIAPRFFSDSVEKQTTPP